LKLHRLIILIASCALVTKGINANSLAASLDNLTGEIKVQHQFFSYSNNSIYSTLTDTNLNQSLLDLRLKSSLNHNNWAATVHYQLNTVAGTLVKANNLLSGTLALPSPQDNTQLFDLSHTLSTDDNYESQHTLDRFFISYNYDKLAIKLGRQALSWGNGLVFRPLDLFNPFSPDAIDTSYKPGTDMFYSQWLFDSGSDISFLIVPRRNASTNQLESEESSIAGKWQYFGVDYQTNLLLAQDYGDLVTGFGISGAIDEGIWRSDIVSVFLDNDSTKTSFVLNYEKSWNWLTKNIHGYIEYFRNGFGSSQSNYTLSDLNASLITRLTHSQVFNTGRDYLSIGANIEQTALLNISPLLIANLNDKSMLLLLQAIYSSSQNTRLEFGFTVGSGNTGTEFSGLQTSTNSGLFLDTPEQLYARFTYYF